MRHHRSRTQSDARALRLSHSHAFGKEGNLHERSPLYGGLSGESRGCADADRLLRQACGRRPQAKAKAKADQPTIFDAEHSRDLSRLTAVDESNYRRPRLL